MRYLKFVFIILLIIPAKTIFAKGDSVLIFSYFKNNGKDGLHLAYSVDDCYTWKALNNDSSFLVPTAGGDKLMRDPCIIRGGDNLFHMVWTVSWNEKGIGYASSADLVNWSEQMFIPVMKNEENALNCWAPEITYDKKNKQYMIYWATTIPGRFTETDSTGDGKYNHRIYYVTTRDFKSFSETKLLYDPGFNVIDASIVPDHGRYIMFFKDETRYPPAKNIHIATSKELTGPFSKTGPAITGKYWAEGPTAIKTGNKWIVYFDRYREHRMGAVTSSDLVNWEDISDKISFPSGTRHGSAFKISKKEFDALINLSHGFKRGEERISGKT